MQCIKCGKKVIPAKGRYWLLCADCCEVKKLSSVQGIELLIILGIMFILIVWVWAMWGK